MKRYLYFLGAAAIFIIGACIHSIPTPTFGAVLFAQSLPATKTASWNVNASSDNVTAYTFTLDGGTPVVIPASSCTATCSTPMLLSTFGAHSYTVFASNASLSGGTGVTGTPQNGPSSALAFNLNQQPGSIGGESAK